MDYAVHCEKTWLFLRLWLLALGLLWPTFGHCQAPLPDYQVKAAVLYHFTQFIEWPLQDSSSPFVICVAGDPNTGTALEQLVRGKSVGSHPLTATKVSTVGEAQQCRVLFLGDGAREQAQRYLQAVNESSVLTVGERSFRGLGGMIELFVEDQRMAFRLNLEAMQHAHLTASSKLLRLARREDPNVTSQGFH